MKVKEAYDRWAAEYDRDLNKTRDLERISLKKTLGKIQFSNCLEIGCGTGKNTQWLASNAKEVLAIDFSVKMLEKARNKIVDKNVSFVQADISEEWLFARGRRFDMITFSLVLEHLENLDEIFNKVKEVTMEGAYVYIGELHPFKQYGGSKARFEIENGLQTLTCFVHHISDFTKAAGKNGFQILELVEYFDNDNTKKVPRILTLLLKRV